MIQWYNGTMMQWCNDTVIQWYNNTVIQWYSDTMIRWYNDTLTHWFNNVMIQWWYDAMRQWYNDSVMQRCNDKVMQWYSDTMIQWYNVISSILQYEKKEIHRNTLFTMTVYKIIHNLSLQVCISKVGSIMNWIVRREKSTKLPIHIQDGSRFVGPEFAIILYIWVAVHLPGS